jgi:hypothetical protein
MLTAAVMTVFLDFAVLAAFWVQPDSDTREDTVRLILFLATPAAAITATTLLAMVRGMSMLKDPAGDFELFRWGWVAVGVAIGWGIGMVLAVTTDVPFAPEIGLLVGGVAVYLVTR